MKKENNLYLGISETEKVDAYMQKLEHPLYDVIVYLRNEILKIDKKMAEGIFWNVPTFYYSGEMQTFEPKTYKRYLVGFNFFQQDCIRLIFLQGASVNDDTGFLQGEYKDGRRLAMLYSMEDAKQKLPQLKKVIKQLLKNMTAST